MKPGLFDMIARSEFDIAQSVYLNLKAPSLNSLISPTEVGDLHYLVNSAKYSSKVELKDKYVKEILGRRGFVHFHSGTNRNAYRFLEDQRFILKMPHSSSGKDDNILEYRNQHIPMPFCTKVFEVSPCGTLSIVERVQPFTRREDYAVYADVIFDIIVSRFIGKYVVADIGTKYFRNWGLRENWGVVLLDFPYIFEVDQAKLFCNRIDPVTKHFCGGVLDYDMGFNEIVCTKCGAVYRANELKRKLEDNLIVKEGSTNMNVQMIRRQTGEVIYSSKAETSKIEPPVKKEKKIIYNPQARGTFVRKSTGEPLITGEVPRARSRVNPNVFSDICKEIPHAVLTPRYEADIVKNDRPAVIAPNKLELPKSMLVSREPKKKNKKNHNQQQKHVQATAAVEEVLKEEELIPDQLEEKLLNAIESALSGEDEVEETPMPEESYEDPEEECIEETEEEEPSGLQMETDSSMVIPGIGMQVTRDPSTKPAPKRSARFDVNSDYYKQQ